MPPLLRFLPRLREREPTIDKWTRRDYLQGLSTASRLAGWWGPGWNGRFRAALREQGLMLASAVSRDDDLTGYPDGRPYQAPRCYGEQDGWPEGSLVAWLPDGGQR